MNAPQKPMRQAMPTVASWIDELREAFGADQINPSLKAGMQGGSDFYASENGHEIGSKYPIDPSRAVSLADCQIGPMNPVQKEKNRG